MIYGYARVSTPKQLKGNSLDDQVKSLQKFGCDKIFKEQYTGTKRNRPEFNKVMTLVEKGDTLVVARLDRLARNMTDMLNIINELKDRGVKTVLLKPRKTLDPGTAIGRAMIGMFATFSQLERDMIHDRMQEGKEFAVKNGDAKAKGGRPNRLSHKTPTENKRYQRYKAIYSEFKEMKHLRSKDPQYYYKISKLTPVKKVAQAHGISVRTVYNINKTFKNMQ